MGGGGQEKCLILWQGLWSSLIPFFRGFLISFNFVVLRIWNRCLFVCVCSDISIGLAPKTFPLEQQVGSVSGCVQRISSLVFVSLSSFDHYWIMIKWTQIATKASSCNQHVPLLPFARLGSKYSANFAKKMDTFRMCEGWDLLVGSWAMFRFQKFIKFLGWKQSCFER